MWVQILFVASAFTSTVLAATPVGSARCGNGTVRFIANATQGGVHYQEVRVNGASDMMKCSDSSERDGQYELFFKPENCNITVPSDGMIDVQIYIPQIANAVTKYDGLNNITCNVTASGMHPVNVTLDTVTVKKAVETIDARDPPLPPLKLVAKDMSFNDVLEVNLGDNVYICAEVTPETRSPYKGIRGKKCYMDKVMFTNDKGCVMMKRMANGMPEGGFKYMPNANATCVKIQAFRGRDQLAANKVTAVCDIEFTLETSQQTDTSCNMTTRRRRDVQEHVVRRYTLLLGLKNGDQVQTENKQPDKKPVEGAPEGYISNTVFYVVVVILACLVIMIGLVAVFFATRARRVRVTSTGKDNPAF